VETQGADPHDGHLEINDDLSAEEIGSGEIANSRRSTVVRYASAILVVGIAVTCGWVIGRGNPDTVSPTRVYLAIESLSAGASVADPIATPSIDGHLFVERAPAGTNVDSVTWGAQTTKINYSSTPSDVTIQTRTDCRTIVRAVNSNGPKVTFPAMSAELVAADGTRTVVPVTALGTGRWQNVFQGCLDPALQIAPASAVLPCSVTVREGGQGGGGIVHGLVVTTAGAMVSVSASYGSTGQGSGWRATDGKFAFELDPGSSVTLPAVTVNVRVTKGDASGSCATSFTP
jgi:hypothetical protein